MKKALLVQEDVLICANNDIVGNMCIENAQACTCGSFGRWFYASSIDRTFSQNKSAEQPAISPTRGICGNPREQTDFNPPNADWQNVFSVGALLLIDVQTIMIDCT